MNIVPVLLTGDHKYTALVLQKKLKFDRFEADFVSEDIVVVFSLYKKNLQSHDDCDGINDAPALRLQTSVWLWYRYDVSLETAEQTRNRTCVKSLRIATFTSSILFPKLLVSI